MDQWVAAVLSEHNKHCVSLILSPLAVLDWIKHDFNLHGRGKTFCL